MAYPSWPNDPLPIGVELTISTGQLDITDDVDRAGLSITRGRSDESSTVGPGSLKFKVQNPTGTYSPRNPASSLYGEIGRNTPCLAYVDLGAPRLVLPAAGYASTPDHSSLDITGDIDLRVDIRPSTWRPSATCWIGVLKFGAYGLYITTDGYLHLLWNDSGAVQHDVASTIPIPGGTTGRKAIRATLDANNGAGGHTVAFYLWTDGTWTAFGDSVVTAGHTTSIINSTDILATYINAELGTTSIYEVQVRNGIGGSLVANPIFTSQTSGVSSFIDSPGRTWTMSTSARLWNRHYRVNAEVAEWPSRWSEKGSTESFVEVEAAGVLRRLSQGASVVRSVLYRESSTLPDLVAYWPLEDADGATTAAGYGSARPGKVTGDLQFGQYEGIAASEPLPKFNAGRLTLSPPANAITGQLQVRFMLRIPTAPADGTVLARIHTTSTLAWVNLVYNTGGGITATAYTDESASLGSTPSLVPGSLLTAATRVSLELTQTGSTVQMRIITQAVGESFGYYQEVTTGVCTLGGASTILLNPNGAALADVSMGHITAQDAVTSLFATPAAALIGYDGEMAVDRIARLADENGLDLELIGEGGESGRCGPQRVTTLLDLLRDAEEVDGGVLYEPDTGHTLAYRSLDSITRQDGLTLAYVENQFRPFEPTEDDQATRNDVTVKRDGGTEYRAVDNDGPAGVDTIGRYDTSVTLPLARDDDAQHAAGWRLNLGTVDAARWPQVGFNLADPRILADPLLVLAMLELDIGDRLTITDLPEWLPPFPADVIVQGIAETMTPRSWQITLNTSPAAPFDVVAYDWDARLDNDTTTLATDVNTTATSWSVATATAPLWTHADGDYDLLIGGEVVRVTAVSGASSPQSFTVTRSINGVVKSHTAGATISLYEPRRLAP